MEYKGFNFSLCEVSYCLDWNTLRSVTGLNEVFPVASVTER